MINKQLRYADVVEWQTRYFEGVVSVCSCEFKSHRLHQWKLKTPKSGVFLYNHTLCKHIKQAATIGKAFI